MNSQMLKGALRLVAGAAILAVASIASAAGVNLSQTTGITPFTVDVKVNVFDVAPGSAIGAYDIAIHYDASVWTATSVDFGSFLSGSDPLGSIAFFDTTVPGLLELQEISLITPLDAQPLNVLQPQAFTFATVHFAALSRGVAGFSIQSASLFNELGDPVAIAAVPEPSTYALMVLGMVGVAARGLSRSKKALQAQSQTA